MTTINTAESGDIAAAPKIELKVPAVAETHVTPATDLGTRAENAGHEIPIEGIVEIAQTPLEAALMVGDDASAESIAANVTDIDPVSGFSVNSNVAAERTIAQQNLRKAGVVFRTNPAPGAAENPAGATNQDADPNSIAARAKVTETKKKGNMYGLGDKDASSVAQARSENGGFPPNNRPTAEGSPAEDPNPGSPERIKAEAIGKGLSPEDADGIVNLVESINNGTFDGTKLGDLPDSQQRYLKNAVGPEEFDRLIKLTPRQVDAAMAGRERQPSAVSAAIDTTLLNSRQRENKPGDGTYDPATAEAEQLAAAEAEANAPDADEEAAAQIAAAEAEASGGGSDDSEPPTTNATPPEPEEREPSLADEIEANNDYPADLPTTEQDSTQSQSELDPLLQDAIDARAKGNLTEFQKGILADYDLKNAKDALAEGKATPVQRRLITDSEVSQMDLKTLASEQERLSQKTDRTEDENRLLASIEAKWDSSHKGEGLSVEQQRQLVADKLGRGEDLTEEEKAQLGPSYGPDWNAEFDTPEKQQAAENSTDPAIKNRYEVYKARKLDEEFDTPEKRIAGDKSSDPEVKKRYEQYKERKEKELLNEAEEKIRLERIEEIFDGVDQARREELVQEVFDKYFAGGTLDAQEQAIFETHEPTLNEEKRTEFANMSEAAKNAAMTKSLDKLTTTQRQSKIDSYKARMERGETLSADENRELKILTTTKSTIDSDFKERERLIAKKLSKDGLSANDEEKLAKLNESLKNVELTDDQLGTEIDKVYARVRANFIKGIEDSADIELFNQLKTEQALRNNGTEASRAKIMAAEGGGKSERKVTAVERETQEILQRVMSLEMQLKAAPRQEKALKEQQKRIRKDIESKKREISFFGDAEQQSKKRMELSPLMMQLAMNKGSIAEVKGSGLKTYAEFIKAMADLNDILRLNGKFGFYKNWYQHMKAGAVSTYADWRTDIDSRTSASDA